VVVDLCLQGAKRWRRLIVTGGKLDQWSEGEYTGWFIMHTTKNVIIKTFAKWLPKQHLLSDQCACNLIGQQCMPVEHYFCCIALCRQWLPNELENVPAKLTWFQWKLWSGAFMFYNWPLYMLYLCTECKLLSFPYLSNSHDNLTTISWEDNKSPDVAWITFIIGWC
jgi:hypothetical protein